jgi:hypothetical protein
MGIAGHRMQSIVLSSTIPRRGLVTARVGLAIEMATLMMLPDILDRHLAKLSCVPKSRGHGSHIVARTLSRWALQLMILTSSTKSSRRRR